MARIGQSLENANLISADQLAEALRAQVVLGGRVGTNLVELRCVTLDVLSVFLGRQRQLPAARAAHFEHADKDLQRRFPADVAARMACLPLVQTKGKTLIASIDPLDIAEIEIVGNALGIDPSTLESCVAPELRVRYQLERVYQIPRDPRFMRAREDADQSQVFKTAPQIDPKFEHALGRGNTPPSPKRRAPHPLSQPLSTAIADIELIELPETQGAEGRGHEAERRTYMRTLADLLTGHPNEASVVARIDRVALPEAAVQPIASTLATAMQQIYCAEDRDDVARLTIRSIEEFTTVTAAILLVVRGRAAVSWAGFCRDGTTLPPIAVPLDQPGLVPAVIARQTQIRGSSGDLNTIDYLLLAAVGAPYGDLVVVPIMVGQHVIGALGLALSQRAPIDGADSIAAAAGAALARLMREIDR